MRYLIFIFAVCISIIGYSQNVTEGFEANNFAWKQSTDGLLFHDQDSSQAGFEIPVNSRNHTVFAAGFSIAGINQEGDTSGYFYPFRTDTCTASAGPLTTSSASTTSDFVENYQRFWFITSGEIDTHLAYFDCLNDSDCQIAEDFPAGYDIPEDFISWPAEGEVRDEYAENLAPWFDYNADGEYNAQDGDHPVICGDFAVYQIRNDYCPEASEIYQFNMGMEIHRQVYGYYSEEPHLFNSLFVQEKIINRSQNTYNDTYIGRLVDFDIGSPHDDYVGTDVQRSMIYGYNGDGFDDASTAGPGYGDDLPIMGMKIVRGVKKDEDNLDTPSISSDFETYANQTTGWGDGVVDNERLGMAKSVYYNNGAANLYSDPESLGENYLALSGRWKNGELFEFGGSGHVEGQGVPTDYIFPGNSDPLMAGTDGVDPNYPAESSWTEEAEGFSAADRRMMASSGPFTFEPGDVQRIDYAFIFARESHEPGTPVLETLQSYADQVADMACTITPDAITSNSEQLKKELGLTVFPNPSKGSFTIRAQELLSDAHISIFDLNGRELYFEIYSGQQKTIEADLAPGVYLLNVQTEKGKVVEKIVVY